jgi:hypothetical protein
MFSLTDVQIVNKALARIGQPYDTVTAVDGTDTSKWGTWAGLEYQSTRNEELRMNEWGFAVTRAALVANTTAPNLTGFIYCYNVPADLMMTCFLYAVDPQWVVTYPLKYLHIVKAPFLHEGSLYYTDLTPESGNPNVKYIREIPLGFAWTEPLFVDALAIRIASKMLPAATANVSANGVATPYLQEYSGLIARAKGRNALDSEDDLPDFGREFWSDRNRITGSW